MISIVKAVIELKNAFLILIRIKNYKNNKIKKRINITKQIFLSAKNIYNFSFKGISDNQIICNIKKVTDSKSITF